MQLQHDSSKPVASRLRAGSAGEWWDTVQFQNVPNGRAAFPIAHWALIQASGAAALKLHGLVGGEDCSGEEGQTYPKLGLFCLPWPLLWDCSQSLNWCGWFLILEYLTSFWMRPWFLERGDFKWNSSEGNIPLGSWELWFPSVHVTNFGIKLCWRTMERDCSKGLHCCFSALWSTGVDPGCMWSFVALKWEVMPPLVKGFLIAQVYWNGLPHFIR